MSKGDGDRGKGRHEGRDEGDEFEVHEVVPAPPGEVEVGTSDSDVSEASEASQE